jgi:ABC-type lipoprotein export system ATPase subunit
MIEGVTIRNFRGLRDVTLDGFARVNVIVGDNGSGKTSLLEALFMAMSNSALQAIHLRQLRGLPTPTGLDQPGATESLGSEFIGEDGKEVTVESRGTPDVTRRFCVAPDQTRPSRFVASPPTIGGLLLPPNNVVAAPVVYRWTDSEGRTDETVLRGGPTPMAVGSGGIAVVESSFLPAAYAGQGGAAALFSELDKEGEATPFIEAIRAQFPEIEVVSVQLEGNQPLLHARLNGQRLQRPLELLSGGLARLSVLLLAVARCTTKIVLVDDIENGLHHRRFGLLWRQIRDFAARADTQVFATTHSLEALDAVADAMAEHPDDFALLRTVRTSEGCVAGLLPGLEARHLLRSGLEVRG